MGKKIVWMIICLFVVSVSAFSIAGKVSAKDHSDRMKCVTSVTIQPGDTLWSIASEYMSEEYSSVSDYVEEIKASNHLFDDSIRTGECLIIPYYTSLK